MATVTKGELIAPGLRSYKIRFNYGKGIDEEKQELLKKVKLCDEFEHKMIELYWDWVDYSIRCQIDIKEEWLEHGHSGFWNYLRIRKISAEEICDELEFIIWGTSEYTSRNMRALPHYGR